MNRFDFEQTQLKLKSYLFLLVLLFFSKQLWAHKSSLVDPDLRPLVGFVYRSENSLPIIQNINFIYYENDSFVLLGSNNGLIEFNLNKSKTSFEVTFDGVRDKNVKLPKSYGGFKLQNTDSFYFCLYYKKSEISPIFAYQNGALNEKENYDGKVERNWPPNYCTTNSGDNFLLITSASSKYSSITSVEQWRNHQIRIRKFQRGVKDPLLHYSKERDLLRLVGGFMRQNVPYFISRERLSDFEKYDARAYVNRISKVCEPEKDSNATDYGPNLDVKTTTLTCEFHKESESTFTFDRLMAFRYDITSHLIFALYNTWENGPAASALCVHSLDEILIKDGEKCKSEHPNQKNQNKFSDKNHPIFMETRQSYFLTMFTKQQLTDASSSDYLMFFASSNGVILKTIVNPERYTTIVVAKFLPQKGYQVAFKQIVDAGSKILMLDGYSKVLTMEKHNCNAYPCTSCERDPFCFWNASSTQCERNNAMELKTLYSTNHISNISCPVPVVHTTQHDNNGSLSEQTVAVQNSTLPVNKSAGITTFYPQQYYSEDNYRDPTPFEKLVRDMSDNREVIREVIFFATPSLLLGLLCGVLATYGIAGIISTRNESREQSYAESEYPAQSNYRAPGSDGNNTAGPNIPGKNSKTYPVANVITTEAQETFLRPQFLQSTSSSSAPLCSSELNRESLSPQYTYIPSEEFELQEPPDFRPPTPLRTMNPVFPTSSNVRATTSLSTRVPYFKCTVGGPNSRRFRRMSDNSALAPAGPVASPSEFVQLPCVIGSPASEQSLYTFSSRPRTDENRKVSQSSSQSSASDNVFTSFAKNG